MNYFVREEMRSLKPKMKVEFINTGDKWGSYKYIKLYQ